MPHIEKFLMPAVIKQKEKIKLLITHGGVFVYNV